MATTHPLFEAPSDRKALIWRYTDFTKFVSMLENGGLFLCRSDRLGDPLEGSLSQPNVAMRDLSYAKLLEQKDGPQILAHVSKFRKWIRQWTLINCWHLSEHESAAMWQLYGMTGQTVAIRTTYDKLFAALPEEYYVGLVRYIDYSSVPIPENNTLWPFLHKRKSFEHEREVRVIRQELPMSGGSIKADAPNEAAGQFVKVDFNALVEAVYVLPGAQAFFRTLVGQVMVRYGLKAKLVGSTLDAEPLY